MSYVATTHDHPIAERRSRNFFGAVFHSIAEFFVLIHQARMVAGDYERLSRLSDRQLKAIGLTRGEVASHVFAKHMG